MIDDLDERVSHAVTIVLNSIPEAWESATCEAIFYDQGSEFVGEYKSSGEGRLRSIALPTSIIDAVTSIRDAFHAAGQPKWGAAIFDLTPPDRFKVTWLYDGCDSNGDIPFDEYLDMRRHETRRKRLFGEA